MATDQGKDGPTIDCPENGPYIVKGLKSLSGSDGAAITVKETIALCRCGRSDDKPFCDGTHAKIGFTSERQAERVPDRRDSYAGARITIHDNRGLCAHAGVCTERLAAVWRMNQEPWIDPDGAGVEAIIETIRLCPSGALAYTLGGTEHRDLDQPPAIRVARDGPYRVTGGVNLKGQAWGEDTSREHYTLCRCGASKNKPFCDGSHWQAGFKAE
jgi:CDGSH-type Zn-finger protein